MFHSQTEAPKIPEIYHSYCFRYTSADVCNELYRNGGPLLLQIYLSTGSSGGSYPAFPGKCSHTVRTWKTLYLEMLYFDHSCRVKHFILQTLL